MRLLRDRQLQQVGGLSSDVCVQSHWFKAVDNMQISSLLTSTAITRAWMLCVLVNNESESAFAFICIPVGVPEQNWTNHNVEYVALLDSERGIIYLHNLYGRDQ